jgi:hypothetical protein
MANMPIRSHLGNASLTPDEIRCLNDAYKAALRSLSLVDRNDPLTKMIADKIIEIGQGGVRDPAVISARAIKALGVHQI